MTLRIPILFVAAALTLGVAACGSDDDEQQAAQSSPDPVAQVEQLSGRATAVTLDAGFVEALTSLKLTPGPLGDASISKAGVASFPITGGNVTYYEPGSVSPFVQGEIDHAGAGLSLEGGGTRVELTDFVVDPGGLEPVDHSGHRARREAGGLRQLARRQPARLVDQVDAAGVRAVDADVVGHRLVEIVDVRLVGADGHAERGLELLACRVS